MSGGRGRVESANNLEEASYLFLRDLLFFLRDLLWYQAHQVLVLYVTVLYHTYGHTVEFIYFLTSSILGIFSFWKASLDLTINYKPDPGNGFSLFWLWLIEKLKNKQNPIFANKKALAFDNDPWLFEMTLWSYFLVG
jgi:hypothetical protein